MNKDNYTRILNVINAFKSGSPELAIPNYEDYTKTELALIIGSLSAAIEFYMSPKGTNLIYNLVAESLEQLYDIYPENIRP